MEKNAEHEKNSQENGEEQWKSATTDADETCQIGPPDRANGLDVRSEVEGIYIDHKVVEGKFGDSYLFIFEMNYASGDKYNLGVWGVQHMIPGMLRIPYGSPVRLVWQGTKDVGKGNEMKMVKVLTPQWVKLSPPQRTNTGRQISEVPF